MWHIKLLFYCVTFTVAMCKDFVYEFGQDQIYYFILGKTEGEIVNTTTNVELDPLAPAPDSISYVNVTVSGLSDLDAPNSVTYNDTSYVLTIYYSQFSSIDQPRHYTVQFKGFVPIPIH